MRKKSIAFGIVLILLALYMIVSRLGYAPVMPFFAAAFTVVFLYTAIKGFIRLHFTTGFLSLAILGCIHDEFLRIEELTPWTLLLSGLLLGVAFDMMFKGVRARRRHAGNVYVEQNWSSYSEEDGADGQKVCVSNTFGTKSKYVNSDAFIEASIENSFGECNVYFNNTILAGSSARIHAGNSFGQTNIFLPSTWRVSVREDAAFGNIYVRGKGSTLEGAPLVELVLECNFGELNVFFE